VITQIYNCLDAFGADIKIVVVDQGNSDKLALIAEPTFDMINFKVTFRDVDVQIARGERNADGRFRDYDSEADQAEYEKMMEI
jgi:hypothetical protein